MKKNKKKKNSSVNIKVENVDKLIKEGKKKREIKSRCKSCGGCGYFLGFIGAAVYYLQTSTGFWNGVLGLLKSLVWPAMLVFELLKLVAA